MVVVTTQGEMMKGKLEPFVDDLLRLRNEGLSFEAIAMWLAKNRKVTASATGIRNFLKKQEIKLEASK